MFPMDTTCPIFLSTCLVSFWIVFCSFYVPFLATYDLVCLPPVAIRVFDVLSRSNFRVSTWLHVQRLLPASFPTLACQMQTE